MIKTSPAFQEAIVGGERKTETQVFVDLTDPDMIWGPVNASSTAPWGNKDQVIDKELDPPKRYGTLEVNRWILDGSVPLFPDGYGVPESLGWTNGLLCGEDGHFQYPPWIKTEFSNVSETKAVMIFFSSDPLDGVAENFTVDIWANGSFSQSIPFAGNKESRIYIKGNWKNPTAMRITCTKWSLPYRRMRVVEMVPGVYEVWRNSDMASFQCTQQTDFSSLSLPYGSVNLSMDDSDRRFEPRNPDSLFPMLKEKQNIDVSIGVLLPTGIYERAQVGRYYMAPGGWKTSENDITMSWYLVDIVGLLANRTFEVPKVMPTTLGEWLAAIVGQLGPNFKNWWKADPAYVNKPVIANTKEHVRDKTCGDILRWVCQASGTFARAEAGTGKLCAEPLWKQGGTVNLDNLEKYPKMSENKLLSRLTVTLYSQKEKIDEETGNRVIDPITGKPVMEQVTEDYVINFPNVSSGMTINIKNPFFHTLEQATEAVRLIASMYGGNVLELTGRGDPSSEIGDVDVVWLDESNATNGRRLSQTFQYQDGVLRGCQSKLLQSGGGQMPENPLLKTVVQYVIITESGYWTPPEGVTEVTLILGGGGQGGEDGEDGTNEVANIVNNVLHIIDDPEKGGITPAAYGANGQNGAGGKIWSGTTEVDPGVPVYIQIGEGGVRGALGKPSKFGTISSEIGEVYKDGYKDTLRETVYGRTGVSVPLPNSSDGGRGGRGGTPGTGYYETAFVQNKHGYEFWVVTGYVPGREPGKGSPGKAGASGFCLIQWTI